jgi:hypothetical protein
MSLPHMTITPVDIDEPEALRTISRREVLAALTPATCAIPVRATSKITEQRMKELRSRHLFTILIELHPILDLGATPAGQRRIVPVSGGRFTGERLRGEVLPHAGSDLLLTRSDGAFQQDVRLALQTHDSALILMTYRGIRHSSAEVANRIARGESVSPHEYYLRTAPFFETAAPAYAWLNRIVTVGVGERRPNGAAYDIFEIL